MLNVFIALASHAAPIFSIPADEPRATRLNDLYALHYGENAGATLWDQWMPAALLWCDAGGRYDGAKMSAYFGKVLRGRRLDDTGYVATQQHPGLGHKDGWPFPLWTQTGGRGWHFSVRGMPYGPELGIKRRENTDGFELTGAETKRLNENEGWVMAPTAELAFVTAPAISVKKDAAPWIRIEWRAVALQPPAKLFIEWTTAAEPDWSENRRVPLEVKHPAEPWRVSMAALYPTPGWGADITRLRLRIENGQPAHIFLKSLSTAVDTRHNINNAVWITGSADYLAWTGDVAYLRERITDLRRAWRYCATEFSTEKEHCIATTWPGHDGRSGVVWDARNKIIRHGIGIGNNYWDLLPFGGRDALATIYYYRAVLRLAEMEEAAARHPEWKIPPEGALDPATLRQHAERVRETFRTLFWSAETGRFVAGVDADGARPDHGYTFLNCEAIAAGLATAEQGKTIFDWLDGHRAVAGDTSTGPDIWHWRFAPRTTTRKNRDYYSYVWAGGPEMPFGTQVQDGGAVLGFATHEMLARLAVLGPDSALQRLNTTLDWFGEVQAQGGYRAYYRQPGRGTLQGGNTAGGLGMDHEFIESALLPQIVLAGFLGIEATPDQLRIRPRLPKAWPTLTVRGVRWQGKTYDITADATGPRATSAGTPVEIRDGILIR